LRLENLVFFRKKNELLTYEDKIIIISYTYYNNLLTLAFYNKKSSRVKLVTT